MTDTPSYIYLSWRKGRSSRRYLVGLLSRAPGHPIKFSYLSEGVAQARQDGFHGYTEFSDFSKQYDNEVLNVFAQRLTPMNRLSSSHIAKFWELPLSEIHNKWSILAYTQGLLATDNFELLADYEPFKGLSFVSDLAGLSHVPVPLDLLSTGEELQWDFEAKNSYDSKAVVVCKSGQHIGYIKKIHCNAFHKWPQDKIKLNVHAIEKNGVVKNIFVKVSMT